MLCIFLLSVAVGSNEGAAARCMCCRCYRHAKQPRVDRQQYTQILASVDAVARGVGGDREQTGGGIKLITSRRIHSDTKADAWLLGSPGRMGQRKGGGYRTKEYISTTCWRSTKQGTQGVACSFASVRGRVGPSINSTSMLPWSWSHDGWQWDGIGMAMGCQGDAKNARAGNEKVLARWAGMGACTHAPSEDPWAKGWMDAPSSLKKEWQAEGRVVAPMENRGAFLDW